MIINWDEYFLGVAKLSALRSKDPKRQVGACIVDAHKKIVGVGYNGFPIGCSDEAFPWGKSGELLETKYPYVVHAELNAILNAKSDLANATMYLTLFPCSECAKAIIQSGIREVRYCMDNNDAKSNIAVRRMFDAAGIRYARINDFDLTLNLDK